jgi:hypothetical protein
VEEMTTEKLGWFDYLLICVVFLIVSASLFFLFGFYESGVQEVKTDSLLIKKVETHEIRLDRIDTLHMKYINEK